MRCRSRLAALLVPLFCLSLAPAAARAAMYLRVGEIKGDVIADGHRDWIAVDQFGVGVSRLVAPPSGGAPDRETSGPRFSDFVLSGPTSRASVHLFGEAVMGREIPEVKLDLVQRRHDDRDEVYAQWVLTDAIMNGYSTTGGGDGRPTESYGFTFATITYNWFEKGGTASVTWDLRENRQSFAVTGTVSNFRFEAGTLVPEPASAAVIGLAGGALLLRRRVRRTA